MIGHLRGTLFEKSPNQIVIEAGGVGYDVQIPISTYTSLGEIGAAVALRIHTHVREDALLLYGFATRDEKAMFERLIGISGIGPKLAIAVLSGLATSDLLAAIRSSDVPRLVRIPGVGKKTAERIVLELKDKVAALEASAKDGAPPVAASAPTMLEQDVLSALQNLGCTRAAAEDAVRKAQAKGVEASFEVLFRTALTLMR